MMMLMLPRVSAFLVFHSMLPRRAAPLSEIARLMKMISRAFDGDDAGRAHAFLTSPPALPFGRRRRHAGHTRQRDE